jgi:hypothetical protein
MLSNELILRGLSIAGNVECRQEKLKDALRGEATIARLAKEIAHGEVKEGAYFLLMHTLPCVLHMENRNGIKLLTMMFIEGLSNAKQGSLYGDVNAEGTRVSRFVSDIERLINSSILGSEDDPCQWMCPFDSKKKEIGPITMDNVRTRRIVDAMDTLVNFCVVDGERALWWTTALNNYRTAMILLRKRQSRRWLLPSVGEIVAERRDYQLHAHDWVGPHCRLPLEVEKSVPVLTTGVGGDELIDQDIFLSKNEPEVESGEIARSLDSFQ